MTLEKISNVPMSLALNLVIEGSKNEKAEMALLMGMCGL